MSLRSFGGALGRRFQTFALCECDQGPMAGRRKGNIIGSGNKLERAPVKMIDRSQFATFTAALISAQSEEVQMSTAQGRLAVIAGVAIALTVAPCVTDLGHGSGFTSAAFAKNGGGNGNSGNGGNGNGGNGNGGNGNSGNGNGGNGNGNNGSGGNSAGQGAHGAATTGNVNPSDVNAATGDKVTIDGSNIQVTHPDGYTETIQRGRFKMKDPLGRTIVDRLAKPADIKRLRGL